MKRIIIILLLLILSIFSYLYNLRNDNIFLYSILSERYVNINDTYFDIEIYSNVEESIYSSLSYNSFYLNCSEDYKLKLINIKIEKSKDLYKYLYSFDMPNLDGLYKDLNLIIKSNEESIKLNLGNYYFVSLDNNYIFDYQIRTNELDNISSVELKMEKEFELNNIYINSCKKSYYSKIDDTNTYNYITIDATSDYFNKELLIMINDCCLIIKNDKINLLYLKGAIYD